MAFPWYDSGLAICKPRRGCFPPPDRATVPNRASSERAGGRDKGMDSWGSHTDGRPRRSLVLDCVQRGEVSSEVAAGLYFEERRALLGTLWRLLQAQALEPADEPQHAGVQALYPWTLRPKP